MMMASDDEGNESDDDDDGDANALTPTSCVVSFNTPPGLTSPSHSYLVVWLDPRKN